jgi:hypothetical protein
LPGQPLQWSDVQAERQTSGLTSEWQLFADHFDVEPEAIDYSHPKWEGFIAGLEVGRAAIAGHLASQSQAAQPDEQKSRAAFEEWAKPRGYSMERTTDSYKSQGTKSAWRGWWAHARFAAPASVNSLEVLDWTRDGMIDGTEFVRLDDVRVHLAGQSQATKVQAVPIGVVSHTAGGDCIFMAGKSSGVRALKQGDALYLAAPTAQEVTQQAAKAETSSEEVAYYKQLWQQARAECARLAPTTQQAAKAETAEQAEGEQANVLPPTRGTGSQREAGSCDHVWPESEGQTDIYGKCEKCSMSFQRYIHTECP